MPSCVILPTCNWFSLFWSASFFRMSLQKHCGRGLPCALSGSAELSGTHHSSLCISSSINQHHSTLPWRKDLMHTSIYIMLSCGASHIYIFYVVPAVVYYVVYVFWLPPAVSHIEELILYAFWFCILHFCPQGVQELMDIKWEGWIKIHNQWGLQDLCQVGVSARDGVWGGGAFSKDFSVDESCSSNL